MKARNQDNKAANSAFARIVNARSGENVYLCYQCRKCASGCPLREMMDSNPTELMRQIQLGMKNEAVKDSTIWLCASCHTCTSRCPQGIDIAHVIDTLKIMAQEEGIHADTHNVKAFNKIWMMMIKHMGRIFEVGLVGLLNLAMKKPLQGVGLAGRMVKKGKLKFLPSIKRASETRNMFKRAEEIKKQAHK